MSGRIFGEEVDLQRAGTPGGLNFGWAIMEGSHCYNSNCRTDGLTLPVYNYPHEGGDCAIMGGYVYRGQRWPALQGWYIFGDFCTGNVRALQMQNGTAVVTEVAQTGFLITSFGEDEQGEIYACDYKSGAIFQLVAGVPTAPASGVVNAASFAGPATPGSLASVFGVGLTTVNGTLNASQFPLPAALNGTSVTLDGIAAPLLAAANVRGAEQINFQVPYELEGHTQASLVVKNNGIASEPVTVSLGVQPGLFAGTRSGTLVQLWATGLGSVSGTQTNGQPAEASETLGTIHVLINGADVTVEYAGLAPGFAGLYQVNSRLPEGYPGALAAALVAGGVTSNTLQLGSN